MGQLPQRLRKVLKLLVEGYTNSEIAKHLVLSVRTIETYVKELKKHFRDQPEARGGLPTRTSLATIGKSYLEQESQETEPLDDYFIRLFTDQLETIQQVRIQGNLALSLEMADWAAARIGEVLERVSVLSSRRRFLRLLALIRIEQAKAYTWFSLPSEILLVTKPVVEEVRAIAKICGEEELFGLADFRDGDAYYIAGQYGDAIPLLNRAMVALKNPDDQLWIRRNLAVAWAHLHEERRFKEAEIEIRVLIEQRHWSKPGVVCNTLEGLSRGQGLLGSQDAFRTWEESSRIYTQMRKEKRRRPFREVELLRTQVELIHRFQPTNHRLLEEVGQEGLLLAQEYEYRRLELQIQQSLHRYLN